MNNSSLGEIVEKLKAYRITKGSTDGTFQPGEIIWKSLNGDINSVQWNGWITPSDVDQNKLNTLDFEVEEATNYEVIKIGGYEICKQIER